MALAAAGVLVSILLVPVSGVQDASEVGAPQYPKKKQKKKNKANVTF